MTNLEHISILAGLHYEDEEYLDDDESEEIEGLAPLPFGKVQCLKCGQVLSNERNGKRHYKTSHQPNKAAKCSFCKKVYKNAATKASHMYRVHGVTVSMMKNVIKPPPIDQ